MENTDIKNNQLVLGEFHPDETKPCALDNLNRKDKDYSHVRHQFVNDDQYDLFCRLPGGNAVKAKIIEELSKSKE